MAEEDDLVCGTVVVPGAALSWTASRSGGPGGQHANTADTKVTLDLDLAMADLPDPAAARLRADHGATVRVQAADSRSQWRNRAIARQRMAEVVEAAARPVRRRRPTRPGRGARERRLEEKARRSQRKQQRRWRPGDE